MNLERLGEGGGLTSHSHNVAEPRGDVALRKKAMYTKDGVHRTRRDVRKRFLVMLRERESDQQSLFFITLDAWRRSGGRCLLVKKDQEIFVHVNLCNGSCRGRMSGAEISSSARSAGGG